MELNPNPEIPSPEPLRRELPRASTANQPSPHVGLRPDSRTGKKPGDSYRGTRSGRAYIPFGPDAEEKQTLPPEKSAETQSKKGITRHWIIVVAAGVVLGASFWTWYYFSNNDSRNLLILTTADINQQLTQSAKASLLQGEVPSFLSNASTEVLSKIKSGEMDLAEKNLVDSTQSAGAMVHVYISINGQAAINEVLTPEHTKATVFPVSRNTITRFHYVVDSAGPSGTVNFSVSSASGTVVSTGALTTGARTDLLVIER
jgi:hypothetical protein